MRSMKKWNPTPMTVKRGRPNPSVEANAFRALMFIPLLTIGFVLLIAGLLLATG